MIKNYSLRFCITALSTFTILAQETSAQHQNDIWYFGSNAGIDFSSGLPVNLLNGQVNTTEGSSVISDTAGNLLFYTDGVTVWNKLHTIMTNGMGLHGGASSTQSALIIQQPGSDSLYYIFTTGEALSFGLQYSIVDMSLQSGNGEVTAINVNMVNNTAEKLTAFRHSNNTDYWIVTHEMNNNRFDVFLFNSTGVNTTAVVSNIGSNHNDVIGQMKSSNKGLKLAVAEQYDNFFELFDFNNTDGTVSNPIHIDPPPSQFGPYGVEFSGNDSLLYGSVYSPGIIAQWDISSNNEPIINASRIVLDTSSNFYLSSLQLAPDGKIYVARYADPFLGVINNPDVYGLGCNYTDEGFNLSPRQSLLGLPNLLPRLSQLPVPEFSSTAVSICQKFCVDFFDQSTNDPTSWEWFFPGGSPSSSVEQNPLQVCYNAAGMYDVTLIATNNFGTDTLTLTNYIAVNPTPPIPTITQSGYTLTCSPAFLYQWQLNSTDIAGATNQSYTATQTGIYTVIITDQNGCFSSVNYYVLITGVDVPLANNGISVYPNLSDGNFIIEWFNGLMIGETKVEVYNMLGEVVYSAAVNIEGYHFIKTIELKNLTSGLYLMKVKTGITEVKKKLMIVD